MPTIPGSTQKQTKYSVSDCVQWYLKYKVRDNITKDEEKAARIRKLKLEGDRIELELAERREELIEVYKITSIWEKVLSEFRTSVLNVPKKITSIWDSIGSNPIYLERALTLELHQSLDNLSRFDLQMISDEDEDETE